MKKATTFSIGIILIIGLSSVSVHAARANAIDQDEINFCQGCKTIVSYVESFKQADNRTGYETLFKDFCTTYYPESTDYQNPCDWFVKGLYFVMDRIDSIEHCDQIGACGVSTLRKQPLLDLSSGRPNNMLVSKPTSVIDNGNEAVCSVCQQLVNEVKAVLDDPEAIDQARQQLDVLCDYLKLVDADKQCKQQVDKYLDQSIAFIKSIDPLNYCQSISLCDRSLIKSSTKRLEINSSPDELLPSLADFKSFGIETGVSIGGKVVSEIGEPVQSKDLSPIKMKLPNCSLCKTIVKELFHFLKENKTESSIRHGLEKICTLVYKDDEKISECNQMVDTYSRELIEFLIAETDPGLICILIEQCTYQKSGRPDQKSIASIDTTEASDESFQTERPSMTSLGRTQSRDNPANVKMPNLTLGEFMNLLQPERDFKSLETCLECKMFIRFLREQIDKPITEEKIKKMLLEKLCDNLEDEDLKGSCRRLVQNYSDIFFKAVVQELNPENACIELQACKNKTLEQPLETDVIDARQTGDLIPFPNRPMFIRNTDPQMQCRACLDLLDVFDTHMSTNSIGRNSDDLINTLCPMMDNSPLCNQMIESFSQTIIHHIAAMRDPVEFCVEAKYCPNSLRI